MPNTICHTYFLCRGIGAQPSFSTHQIYTIGSDDINSCSVDCWRRRNAHIVPLYWNLTDSPTSFKRTKFNEKWTEFERKNTKKHYWRCAKAYESDDSSELKEKKTLVIQSHTQCDDNESVAKGKHLWNGVTFLILICNDSTIYVPRT